MAFVHKAPRFSAARAVAWYLGEDEAAVRNDRRYQPTRTYCPVFTVGNDYLTATPAGRKPRDGAERGGFSSFNWVEILPMPVPFGWRIWRHVEGGEE